MKTGMMVVMAALLNLGSAQADTLDPKLGFDRVGYAAGEQAATPKPARFIAARDVQAAPGEGGEAGYAERKREMARRLLWLMLSAR